jgi:hypothetical protein
MAEERETNKALHENRNGRQNVIEWRSGGQEL